MRQRAGAGGPTQTANVIAFPGCRLASPAMAAPDTDLLLTAAGKLAGLALHVSAVRVALEGLPCPLPSGLLERLGAVEGQLDTMAASVEGEALFAQGAGDAA